MCDRFDPKPYTGGLLCKCGAAKKSHVGAVPKPPAVSHTRTSSPISNSHTRSDSSVTAATVSSASRTPIRTSNSHLHLHSRTPSSLSRAPPPPSASPSSSPAISAIPAPAASPARPAPSRLTSPTRLAQNNEKKPDVVRATSKDKASRSVSPPSGRHGDVESKESTTPPLEKKASFLGRPGKPAPHRPPSASPSRFSSLLAFTSRSASVCSSSASSPPPPPSSHASSTTSSYPPSITRPASSSATSSSSSTSSSPLHSSRTLPSPALTRLPSLPPSLGHLTAPASFGRSLSSPPPVSSTNTSNTSTSISFSSSSIPSSSPTLSRPPSGSSLPSSIPLLRPAGSHPSPPSQPSAPPVPDPPDFSDTDNGAFASMTILSELTGSDSPIHDELGRALMSQIRGPRPQHAPPSRPRASAPAPPPSPFIQLQTPLCTTLATSDADRFTTVNSSESSSSSDSTSAVSSSETDNQLHTPHRIGQLADPAQPLTGTIGTHALSTPSLTSSLSPSSNDIAPSPPPAPLFTLKSPLVHSRSSPDLHRVGGFRRVSAAPPTPPSRPPPASPSRIPRDPSPASRDPSPSGGRVRELSPAPSHLIEFGPVPRMRDLSPFQREACSLVPFSQLREPSPQRIPSATQRYASPQRAPSDSMSPPHQRQPSDNIQTVPENVPIETNTMSHESTRSTTESTTATPAVSPPLRPRPGLFLHSRADLESLDDGVRSLGPAAKKSTLSLGHSSSSPDLGSTLRRPSNVPPARPPPPSPSRVNRDPQSPKDSSTNRKREASPQPTLSSIVDGSATSSSSDDDEDRDTVPPLSTTTAAYYSNSWAASEGQYPVSMHHAILSMLAFRLPPPELWNEH